MSFKDLIKRNIGKIFQTHITKEVSYNGNVYSAITSSLVSQNDYSSLGITEQADITLIFPVSVFNELPKAGEYFKVDNITYKIGKPTLSNAETKVAYEISRLKTK